MVLWVLSPVLYLCPYIRRALKRYLCYSHTRFIQKCKTTECSMSVEVALHHSGFGYLVRHRLDNPLEFHISEIPAIIIVEGATYSDMVRYGLMKVGFTTRINIKETKETREKKETKDLVSTDYCAVLFMKDVTDTLQRIIASHCLLMLFTLYLSTM